MRFERPVSIIWFERIAYLALILSVVNFNIVYGAMRRSPGLADGPPGAIILLMLIMLVIYIPLVLFAARRASNVARWILAVLLGIHLLGLLDLRAILNYGGPSAVIALGQFPISVVLIWLLFRADARRWFRKGEEVDPDVFR